MPYPKKWMTINELEKQCGLSKEDLKIWVNAKDFPSMRNGTRGHWRINTDLLDSWLIKKGFMKKPSEDLLKISSLMSPNISGLSVIDELIKLRDALKLGGTEASQ